MSDITSKHLYMAAALANPNLCTGTAPDWQIRAWFDGRGGVTREEIVARQAKDYADAMMKVFA
jgi:hypothetical protein